MPPGPGEPEGEDSVPPSYELDSNRPSLMLEGMDLLSASVPSYEPPDLDSLAVEESMFDVPSSSMRYVGLGDDVTVLVIDAAKKRRDQLERVLGRRYRVLSASTAGEGLLIGRSVVPDLIVADMELGDLNGHELCAAVKSDPGPLARTPVVLLSHKHDLRQKLAALDRGADDFLVKPVHVAELRSRVRNLVRIRRQERELLEALRALEARDGVITQDILRARDFQQSLLPEAVRTAGLSLEVTYQPAEMVGGDLYDVFELEEGRVRVFLADAPGHGVPAALTTMFIKSQYELCKRAARTPEEALSTMNRSFAGTFGQLGLHFTAVCFDLDARVRGLRWATAAHPPLVLIEGTSATELPSGGAFVGLDEGATFLTGERELQPGARVYAYTDGLVEQPSPTGEPFGEARLTAALLEATRLGRGAGNLVCHRVAIWAGPTPPYDDLTLLGARLVGPAAP
ncbi:MAG: SpoIIE family protein phosphatase [Polyangiaceae bacterium]|nr:SpoIIE family protein phosphatase [Polyangiaceae bacterium]